MNGVLSISVESRMSRKIRIKVQYPEKVQTNSNGNKLDQILGQEDMSDLSQGIGYHSLPPA